MVKKTNIFLAKKKIILIRLIWGTVVFFEAKMKFIQNAKNPSKHKECLARRVK